MLKELKKAADKIIAVAGRVSGGRFPVSEQLIKSARILFRQNPPINAPDLPPAVHAWFSEEVFLPDQIIYTFDKVKTSWHGVVINFLQIFVPSLAYPIYKEEFAGIFLLKQWLAKSAVVETTIALVYDHWAANNYYHWLIDTLPRIVLLKEKYPDCLILAPGPIRDYVKVTTAALGCKELCIVHNGEFLQTHKLLMPSHVAPPGKQDPLLIRTVRTMLIKNIPTSTGAKHSKKNRVYVSRNRQSLRRLANEESIMNILLDNNINIIYFEDMSFEQQISLMQNVDLLVGLHGANLTNMLVMPAGAKVVELFNQEVCNLCYFHLASNLELKYYGVPCHPIIGSSPVDIPNGDDVLVDVEFLKKVLQSL